MNLLLAAALLASALYLVRTTYESRKLFVALEAEHARERRLQIELEQLEVAKRAQATPLRVEKIAREKVKGQVHVTRFKGLGEMNPLQLRETTMARDTRRLVQLTLDEGQSDQTVDMLLNKKRAGDRKDWLEREGNRAEV